MNRKSTLRILSLILLLALLGTGATAASLSDLLEYAKAQGFTVKVKSSTNTKATISYAESSKGNDVLTWTTGNKKCYSIKAASVAKKTDLRDLFIYMVCNYKWKAGSYKINSTATYGFNVKKGKAVYKTLTLFRKAVKKHVNALKGAKKYVLNTNSRKFHLPSCSDANRISAKNKKTVTTTREQLIGEGYSPCKHCNP